MAHFSGRRRSSRGSRRNLNDFNDRAPQMELRAQRSLSAWLRDALSDKESKEQSGANNTYNNNNYNNNNTNDNNFDPSNWSKSQRNQYEQFQQFQQFQQFLQFENYNKKEKMQKRQQEKKKEKEEQEQRSNENNITVGDITDIKEESNVGDRNDAFVTGYMVSTSDNENSIKNTVGMDDQMITFKKLRNRQRVGDESRSLTDIGSNDEEEYVRDEIDQIMDKIDDDDKERKTEEKENDSNKSRKEKISDFVDQHIKSIIYGGLDGAITTFAVVAGVQGANLSAQVLLALGFGNLLADAISMGAGDYLSEKAENGLSKKKYCIVENAIMSRNKANNLREKQLKDLIQSYKSNYQTLDKQSIIDLVRILNNNDEILTNYILYECDAIEPPDDDSSPIMSGFVTMCSFILFGFVPLVAYVFFQIFGLSSQSSQTVEFIITIVLTLLMMCVLGALSGKVTQQPLLTSALSVAANGSAAAIGSYLISWAVAEAVGIRE